MTRPEKKMRRTADDHDSSSLDGAPNKNIKSGDARRKTPNFPPEFYDSLHQVRLTSLALREIDRRNRQLSLPAQPERRQRRAKIVALRKFGLSNLAVFATRGGPEISHLRGHQRKISIPTPMAPNRATDTRMTRPSTPYDANFAQHLIDNNIYPPLYGFPDRRESPKPANLGELKEALRVRRASLSPSLVPESAFEDFEEKNTTESKITVMRKVVPLLAGNTDIPNEGHIRFLNLDSITSGTTVKPLPDFFDGARPSDLDRKVREDLNKVVVPAKKLGVPVAPNFFFEVKTSDGNLNVAKRQAVFDGAYGAVIMHALQNYLLEEPTYDGNAYAFTAILCGETLTLYAHHLTAPVTLGQRPEQHTTRLRSYALMGDTDLWLEGTGAFRNLRELAKGYRDRFIEAANTRARSQHAQDAATAGDDLAGNAQEQEQKDECWSPLGSYGCQIFAEPEDSDHEAGEMNVGSGILHATDDAGDTNLSTDPPASFTSSVTSDSQQGHQRSRRRRKLPRSPPSPSSPHRAKKRR